MKHIEAMRLALEKTIEMLTDNREYIEANERPAYLAMYDKAIADAEKALAEQPSLQNQIGDEWTPCVKLPVTVHVRKQRDGETHVSTREGITPVKPDDLIMRGVSGEEYPIGREIFEQTYRIGKALEEQAGPVVPEGWKLGSPITEAMHVAACKVLRQANGLDGTPQRMLDAMLAAAPAPQAEQPVQQEQIRSALEQYDLEQSPDYRKGWDDGRKKGYEVGHRHGLEQHLFAAKEQPQQEPVAYSEGRTLHWHDGKGVNDAQLYLAPPQRQPLTDEQWHKVHRAASDAFFGCTLDSVHGQIQCAAHAAMRATEAVYGITESKT